MRSSRALWHAMNTFAGTRRSRHSLCQCMRHIGCRTVSELHQYMAQQHAVLVKTVSTNLPEGTDPAAPGARPGMLAMGLPAALGRERLPAAAQRRRRLVCGGRHSGQHVLPGL